MIGYSFQRLLKIAVPDAIEKVGSCVVSKPVAACHPNSVAIHINDLVAVGCKPVIALYGVNVIAVRS